VYRKKIWIALIFIGCFIHPVIAGEAIPTQLARIYYIQSIYDVHAAKPVYGVHLLMRIHEFIEPHLTTQPLFAGFDIVSSTRGSMVLPQICWYSDQLQNPILGYVGIGYKLHFEPATLTQYGVTFLFGIKWYLLSLDTELSLDPTLSPQQAALKIGVSTTIN